MWLWLEKSGFYKAVQTTARFDGKCSSFEYLCFEIIFCDRFSSLILIGGGRRLGLLNWYHFVCFSSCLYDTGCDVRVCHGDNQERKSSYDADPHHWGHWLRHRGMQTLTQGQKHRGEPSRQNGGLSQTRPWDEQVCDLLYYFIKGFDIFCIQFLFYLFLLLLGTNAIRLEFILRNEVLCPANFSMIYWSSEDNSLDVE